MVSKIIPLHDRVVVEPMEDEERSSGGVLIPDVAKEKPTKGKVVSVGTGARDKDGNIIIPAVKAGDIVMFTKWTGTECKLQGKSVLIMKESDILGICED